MIPPPSAPDSASASPVDGRLEVAGKFFRQNGRKVFLNGVSYGPFKPNAAGEPFPELSRLKSDLQHIWDLGFDTVRVYHPPNDALLVEATRLGLKILAGIAWTDHVDFLADRQKQREIRRTVAAQVARLQGHPCVPAFLIGNEIEKTLVRWMGPRRVQRFLEKLIALGQRHAPGQLFSYATYPSTEYLVPRNADFLAVNVYLEQPEALSAYLMRLQNMAGNKPLLITEFGIDTATRDESAQAQAAVWERDCLEAAGAAGHVWFSYTDEWHRGGNDVTEWKFGLVDANRHPRAACDVMKARQVQTPDRPPMLPASAPRISVIVCTYNGTATLAACLLSLRQLRYPDYEVLVIDDGSDQDIAVIVNEVSGARLVRQEHAGLSTARNLGASLATGEILAYMDDDCIADEDWLLHLARALDDPQWVAAGGPNIPPPPRNRTEATVAAAPGAPAHVLLTDIEAEHLPGCNLAIRKSSLDAVGGFHPHYRVAGDDVDICWRLRAAGGRLRFAPAAMVWHHRRYTVEAYLRQQGGYGHAEALLMKDHPGRFGPLGGARWRGGIYGDQAAAHDLEEGSIFHGPFGSGLFQGIYQQGSRCLLEWLSGILWVALALVLLLVGQFSLAGLVIASSLLVAGCRLSHLPVPPFDLGWGDRLLLLLLCWLQPIVREWRRLSGMIRLGSRPSWRPKLREVFEPHRPRKFSWKVWSASYWSAEGKGRQEWLTHFRKVLDEQGAEYRLDDGWRWFDVELGPRQWVSAGFSVVSEYHENGGCLTRIRATQRVSKGLLGVMLLCLGLILYLGGRDIRGISLSEVVVLLLVVVFFVHLAVTALRTGKYAAALAAERCSLQRAG